MTKHYARHYKNVLLKYWYSQVAWPYYARRYAKDFDAVPVFLLFLGYPRSGHTLVGSLLDAHPEAWIAHELDVLRYIHKGSSRNEIMGRLIGRGKWFRSRNYTWTGYSYNVPNQWQGKFRKLQVIGDKRGGATTRWLTENPGLLNRLQEVIGTQIRIVHNVRNPYDNIATRARDGSLNPRKVDEQLLLRKIQAHFRDVETISHVLNQEQPPVLTIRHEDFIAAPRQQLEKLCRFAGLEPREDYLADAASLVRASQRKSRHKISWSPKAKALVAEKIAQYGFLHGYSFEE